MAATDAKPFPIKNTAYRVYFPILDADGDLVTGATGLDSEVSLDGATFADCTNEATEIATSSGIYYLDLTSSEMNTDCTVLQVKTSSSGAKTTVMTLYPVDTGDVKVDVTAFGGTAGAFAGGRPEVNASHAGGTAWASGAITADSIASNAITAAKIATGAIASAKFAAGAIDAAAIATDAITDDKIQTAAITASKFASGAIDAAALNATAVAEIADGVWDEAISGHLTSGTTGAALNGAGSAGDPWSTALPGAYGAGTAGKIVGDNLNGTMTSRASQTSLDTLATYVDTEVAAIKTKTDNLPAAPAATGDIPTAAQNAAGLLDLANGVETGLTVRESLRAAVSALVGILAGAATGTITIRNYGNTKTRITATVDADGNRSAVTLDVS